ncbi:MAG TPA: hypothetical protein VFL29_01125 [Candidatus Dormibacteraeota bacterium]|nr:hypothetical protein [Candidatus Dormibacteraeota bacterium]
MWSRAGAVGMACVIVALQAAAVSATDVTADLIPGPPAGSWQVDTEQTGPLTKDDIYGSKAGRVQGFVDAYEKTWTGAPATAVLDRLEHYSSIFWAAYRLGQAEAADKKDRSFTSYRTVPGFASGAYEVTTGPDANGVLTDVLVFTQGDYLAGIGVAAKSTPDRATLMDQANRQLALIPEPVGEINGISSGIMNTVVIAAIAAGAITIVVCAIVLIVVLRRRRRVPAQPQPLISADGRYWWDGTTWRPRPPG